MTGLVIAASLIGFVVILHLLASLFIGKALKTDIAAIIQQYPDIDISCSRWITLQSRQAREHSTQLLTGLVFIPGGYADADAYIPLLLPIARQGITCFIVPSPGRLAILDRFAADRVIEAHPQIQDWFLGGHSLGGAVINMYIRQRYKTLAAQNISIQGLIFLGSYFVERHSLAAIPLPTLSIYGTEDGFADRFEPNEHNLTNQRSVIKINGGNHGQFAYYGKHLHDNPAIISREEQHAAAQQSLQVFINKQAPTLRSERFMSVVKKDASEKILG